MTTQWAGAGRSSAGCRVHRLRLRRVTLALALGRIFRVTIRLLVLVFALASPEQLTHSAPVLAPTLTGRRARQVAASVLRPHPRIRSKAVEPCHQDDRTASPRSRTENSHSLQVATLSSIRKKFRRSRLSLFIRQHTRGRISTAFFRGNAMAVNWLDSTSLPIR